MKKPSVAVQTASLLAICWLLSGCNKLTSQDIPVPPEMPVSTQDQYGLDLRSHHATLNEISMHYLSEGEGQILIMLHGFPYFSGVWHTLIPQLSQRYRVVAPDLRGFGLSDKPEAPDAYRLPVLVEDIRQLVEHVSPQERVVLMGHDWGGVLAWAFAAAYPDKVERMVVINAPPIDAFLGALASSESQRHASRYIPRLKGVIVPWLFALKGPDALWQSAMQPLADKGLLDNRFKRAYFMAYETENTAPGALNWYKANVPDFDDIQAEQHVPSEANTISTPSLLIWSERDKAFTQDTLKRIPQYAQNLTIHTLATDSHSPFLDTPAEVSEVISTFLAVPEP